MEQAIQKITDAIYQEGRDKGQAEADRIVAEARKQAEQIVGEARRQAEEVEAAAKKAAAELDGNTRAELKLYAAQALNALKSEITTMVTDKVTAQAVADLKADPNFIGRFVVEVAGKWAADEKLVVGTADAKALQAYAAKHAKALLDKGLTIKEVNGHDTMLTLSPVDGSYKVNFGDAEFANYLKDFLRPALVQMLF